MNISIYKTVKDQNSDDTIEISDFLEGVRTGRWQDYIIPIRAEKDKEKIRKLKLKIPAVTISGTFEERKDSSIIKHSGFMAIDIDDLHDSVEDVKYILSQDKYIYAAFSSVSGRGICAIIKIEPEKHRRAYDSFADYLLNNYKIDVDASGKNESRLRFVSYDPFLYLNENATTFRRYLPVQKKRQLPPPIQIKGNLERIISEMVNRGVNCTEDYRDWIKIGFAIASDLGESGRDHFHSLSAISSKYDSKIADKKYDNILKSLGSGSKKASIATVYWFAKNAGIELYDKKTQEAIRSAASQKRNGVLNKNDIVNSLKLSGIESDHLEQIAEEVLQNETPQNANDLLLDITNYILSLDLKKNEITRNIEWNGIPINDSDLNSIFLDVKMLHEKASKDLVQSIIFSNRIKQYNPIMDFLNIAERKGTKNIDLLLDSVISDTEDYKKWILKWLVALIATAHGKHSPLMLVLAGEKQGTGKTHFFRYLLPNKLQNLYAESKMDNGKDDEILMTKKWIIVDDEMGGKSKREAKKFKEITSKQWINVREPYGRVTVDLKRTAMFAGTSNDMQLLNDPTGNRRYLPIHVLDIDQDKYNECDKSELLWELNNLYQSGYDYTVLKEDIEKLNKATENFKESTPEEEFLLTYITKPSNQYDGEWLPISVIIEYLKFASGYKSYLNNQRIGQILSKMNYTSKHKRYEGVPMKVYHIKKTVDFGGNDIDDVPF